MSLSGRQGRRQRDAVHRRYYMFQTIGLFDRVGGLLALVSAMFTVSWIQRNNEMTALMSAGVSRIRVLLPIIVAVAVVSLILAANREIVIPRFRHELSLGSKDPSGSKPQSLGSRYDGRTDVLLGGKNSFADQQRIEEPRFSHAAARSARYGDDTDRRQRLLQAALQDAAGRSAGRILVQRRAAAEKPQRPAIACRSEGQPVLMTPCDTPWLKPDECFLVSDGRFRPVDGRQGPDAVVLHGRIDPRACATRASTTARRSRWRSMPGSCSRCWT